MKELRCLVFTEQEVAAAVVERRRRLREPMPDGTIQRLSYRSDEAGAVIVTLHVLKDNGQDSELFIPTSETTAALVNFCMSRKIPMPVDSDKYLQVVKDGLTMMITMRFNRAHKAGTGEPETPEEPQGRLGRIVRPPR
ncbi:MAG: hypothetical protein WCF85_01405 [Rhodospirillaceae bacterium]